MIEFSQLAQSLTVALKVVQMYTAAHPRSQEAMAVAHANLYAWLLETERLQFVISGPKAFADGQVQDPKNPHIATLVRLITERGCGGFVFERGLIIEELLTFVQGLTLKPARLEEQGGFEGLFKASGVTHIKVSQTRYQEITEGEEAGAGDRPPAFAPVPAPPAPPPPSEEQRIKALQEALLASMTRGAAPKATDRVHPENTGTAPGGSYSGTSGGEDGGTAGGMFEDGGMELVALNPADLSGLGSLAEELGIGQDMPSLEQLELLREVLLGLPAESQLNFLAGLGSLPTQPAGLALAVKALTGETLAQAIHTLLSQGATWPQLRNPVQDVLRPLPDRDFTAIDLSNHLSIAGRDPSQIEAILRQLDWEQLSLESKLLKVLEEDYLFELSLEQRLALLRELLEQDRVMEFLRVQELLTEALRVDEPELRLKASQTLTGMTRWSLEPGLPIGSEGPLAEALRAHFAWEPDPPIHRSTNVGLETLVIAQVHRGEFDHIISDFQELEGLCIFFEEQNPWRLEALARLRATVLRPQYLDLAISHALAMKRDQMVQKMHPYLEFLGDPMARHLVGRLGEEDDRTRRGRLVEVVRSMGPTALPALQEALLSPAWFLVRNALTLLSDLGDAGCLPSILPLLRYSDPRVRRTAVRALWKLGGPVAEPHLLAQMKETDGETMQEILFALGQLRSEASLPQVATLAQDKRVLERLRVQALETLGLIASPGALPVLLECLRRKGFFSAGEPLPVRLAAARALVSIGTPEALTAVQRAVSAAPKGEERESLRRLLDQPRRP